MKICLAQTSSKTGDIEANISRHRELTEHAISHGTGLIVFPELSICAYEPETAVNSGLEKEDSRFNIFQELSNAHKVIIGIGVPLKQENGVAIAMLIFQPGTTREVYAKKYLHSDEESWFVSGQSTITALGEHDEIALAICYEISVPQHAHKACHEGTKIYLSSVAKTISGVEKASERLSNIAIEKNIITMMSNCTGPCEGQKGGGQSAVWTHKGDILSRLGSDEEGLLIFDTETKDCLKLLG